MLRKFCIINTCGSEDCGNHQQDHEHGAYYLVQDVDARIAELEKQLRRAEELFQDECDPLLEPDSYDWLQSTRELMGAMNS